MEKNYIKQMKDFNIHNKYDCINGKSEYQCHMEWMRSLLISMQEIGVDDRYGDRVSGDLASEIKWLTDRIELAKRENEYIKINNYNIDKFDKLNEKQKKVAKLINDIASCLCYPNDSLHPRVDTVTNEFEEIFNENKNSEEIKQSYNEGDKITKSTYKAGTFLYGIPTSEESAKYNPEGQRVFIHDGYVTADGYGKAIGYEDGVLKRSTGYGNFQWGGDVRLATEEEIKEFFSKLYASSKPISNR